MKTLGDLIAGSAARFGPSWALAMTGEGGASWSYADLHRYARRVARMLGERGIGVGERIVIWAPNSPRWVGTFFGCALAGVVVVPLDVRGTVDFLAKVVAQTEPRLILTGGPTTGLAAGIRPDTLALDELDGLLPPDDPAWVAPDVKPDDLVELLYTSGTTGAPKGVMLSHRNILSDLEAVVRPIPPKSSYRLLSLLPLSHSFEQIAELFFAIFAGARVVYVPSLQPAVIFDAMRASGITTIAVVPQVLALFMSGIEREVRKQGKWASWQRAHRLAPLLPMALRRRLFRSVHARLGGALDFVICGGARLDPELAQRWENLGIKVVIGYGVTEASPIVTVNALARRNLRSVGRPLACNELRLAPDGEVLLRGANLTRGYWHDDAATAAAFDDGGWYHTGDLGTLDRGGHLSLKGRKKNMIVLANGLNVYPEDVEAVLLEQEGVRDAVVLGRERGSEVELHAVLLLEEGAEGTVVVKRANGRLAPHQRLKGHVVWGEPDFPRTPTLKPKREEIARHAWG